MDILLVVESDGGRLLDLGAGNSTRDNTATLDAFPFPIMASSSGTALKTFNLENDVLTIDAQDEIFTYDAKADREFNRAQPWTKEYVLSFVHIPSLRRDVARNTSRHAKSAP